MNYKGVTSVELEVEHLEWNYEKLKEYRTDLYNKYENQIKNLKVKPDISLLNGGVEIAGVLTPVQTWKRLIDQLRKDMFVLTKRTGIHIHFDMTDIIKNVDDLHLIIKKINTIQMNRLFHISYHLNSFHNIYPPTVIKKLLQTDSIEKFAYVYLHEFRAKQIHNVKNALMLKGLEHEHWVDLSPILRYLLKCPIKNKQGYVRASGSIELRFSLVTNKDKGRLYERITFKKIQSIIKDMLDIRNYLRKTK